MAQKTRLGLAGIPRPIYNTSLYSSKSPTTSLAGAEGMTEEEWFMRRRRLRRNRAASGGAFHI